MQLPERIRPLRTLPLRAVRWASRNVTAGIYRAIVSLPCFHFVRLTRESPVPRTLTYFFCQKVLGINRKAYWPVHFTSKINQPQNIVVGIDTCPGYEPGCYIQGLGRVVIGDYTRIAQNVGIIGANHVPEDPDRHDKSQQVTIGDYCWIGMNVVILPGVQLGDFTVVGAGSIVTRSFPDGYCVVAGNPARLIRNLDPEKCQRRRLRVEYSGYLRASDFPAFRARRLWV